MLRELATTAVANSDDLTTNDLLGLLGSLATMCFIWWLIMRSDD